MFGVTLLKPTQGLQPHPRDGAEGLEVQAACGVFVGSDAIDCRLQES